MQRRQEDPEISSEADIPADLEPLQREIRDYQDASNDAPVAGPVDLVEHGLRVLHEGFPAPAESTLV